MTPVAKRIATICGVVLTMAAVGYFTRSLIVRLGDLSGQPWGTRSYLSILLTLLMYVVAVMLGAAAWLGLLRRHGESLSWRDAFEIYATSQIGKYVPGNFAQHLGRISLSQSRGVSAVVVTQTVVEEIVLVLLAGLLVAVFSLPANPLGMDVSFQRLPILRLGTAFVVAVVVSGLILVARSRLKNQWSVLRLLPMFVAMFVIQGGTATLVAIGVYQADTPHLLAAVGVFAMAWTAGFLTPGSPAGVGIREAILVVGFTPLYGETTAIGLAAILRLVSTVGDGIVFSIGQVSRISRTI